MKRFQILFLILSSNWLILFSQSIRFYSSDFENVVREHLGVDSLYDITNSQLDTITCLDLSGLELSDVLDISRLTNVKRLYLQNNNIDDVSPLSFLDSLEYVDLSNNRLESINVMAFSHSSRIEMDISFNHILDFSLFHSLTSCRFTIIGSALQTVKDSPFFKVCYLYGDGSEHGAFARCCVKSNTSDKVQLESTDKTTVLPTDGTDFSVQTSLKETNGVYIKREGIVVDSTILIPLQIRQLKASETIFFRTGLPEHYRIKEITPASQGTLKIVGTNIEYAASNLFESEKIFYSYYDNDVFKGISQLNLGSEPTGIQPNELHNTHLKLVMIDSRTIQVACNTTELSNQSTITVFAPSGQQLASKQVDSSNGIDTTISINGSRYPVLIVQVVSGKKKWIEKVISK